jgi:hypothetical protein
MDPPPRDDSTENSGIKLRPLTEDEIIMAMGCIEDDWHSFQSTNNQSNIKNPPFLAEYPAEREWSQRTRELLLAESYSEARLILAMYEEKAPEARNLLGVLDALELGYGSDPKSAFLNFRIAANKGSNVARANLGICFVFGIGVPVNPIYGGELLRQSIHGGVAPEKATWLLRNGLSLVQAESYAEIIKSIRLETVKGAPIALTVEGILAAQGLAKEPCAPSCSDVARDIATKLRTLGEPGLAALVEANANNEKGKEAVHEATRLFPEKVLKAASQRYLENTERELELERARAIDPVRSAVKKIGRIGR